MKEAVRLNWEEGTAEGTADVNPEVAVSAAARLEVRRRGTQKLVREQAGLSVRRALWALSVSEALGEELGFDSKHVRRPLVGFKQDRDLTASPIEKPVSVLCGGRPAGQQWGQGGQAVGGGYGGPWRQQWSWGREAGLKYVVDQR